MAPQERGRKLRYDVVFREKVNDIYKPEQILNRQGIRPGNSWDELVRQSEQQWGHHSYNGKRVYRYLEFWDTERDAPMGWVFWYKGETFTHIWSIGLRRR